MTTSDVAVWGRRYAELGWAVFPLRANDKEPATEHGFHDATRDPEAIGRMFPRGTRFNIGGAVPPGLIVVDLDSPEAGRALAATDRDLPTTARSRTPRPGEHLIYRLPEGVSGRQSNGEIAEGVDTRAHQKGYVVLPPSTRDGRSYEWITPPIDGNITDAPGWLIRWCQEDRAPRAEVAEPGEPIREGTRNGALASLAGSMRRRGMTAEAIEAALLTENEARCSPPLPDAEVQRIASSISKYEPSAPVATAPAARSLISARLADVEPVPVRWLWRPYLPAGKLVIIEGDPGLGKTWVSLALAATVSAGGSWPDGSRLEAPGPVIYVTFEDGVADTLRPRLDALGADVSRVYAVTGWRENGEDKGPLTAAEVDLLAAEADRLRPRLVVIDPIQGYMGAGVDMHRANETRAVLARLGQVAEATGATVAAVRHLRKAGADHAIHRGLGSIDFAAAARSILLVGMDPEDDDGRTRVVAHVKSSLDRLGDSLAFSLAGGRFGWLGASTCTAGDLLAAPRSREERSATDEAAAFLEAELASGPRAVAEVMAAAEKLSIAKRTLERAKSRLGVESRRVGGVAGEGHWVWSLTPPGGAEGENGARIGKPLPPLGNPPIGRSNAAVDVPTARLAPLGLDLGEPPTTKTTEEW